MLTRILSILTMQAAIVLSLHAQTTTVQNFELKQPARFIENKGQVSDQHYDPRPDVKYIYTANGFKLILKENSFSYELSKVEKAASANTGNVQEAPKQHSDLIVSTHHIDVEWIGANSHPEILAGERDIASSKYYLAHTPEQGVAGVHGFSKLTYWNIYPNVDFVFYANRPGKLKYDIIIRPGGKLEDIKLKRSGMDEQRLQNGRLWLSSALGYIEEIIPCSYIQETGEYREVDYELIDGVTGFVIIKDELNKTRRPDSAIKDTELLKTQLKPEETLVIDPEIIWGTYYGSSGNEGITSMKSDKWGNLYMCGFTTSTAGIASKGAYKTSYRGNYDAFIAKFTPQRSRAWATYYGGTGYEEKMKLALDKHANIYMTGATGSTSGIATSGAFRSKPAFLNTDDSWDLFLSMFDSSGTRLWGTYNDIEDDDYPADIKLNSEQDIILAGTMRNGSGTNAMLLAFHPDGQKAWDVSYGAGQSDYGYSIDIDKDDAIYLAGSTMSAFGITTPNAYSSTFSGDNTNAFLVKFTPKGTRKWGTYYNACPNFGNIGSKVVVDSSGNVFAAGICRGSISILKFDADGNLKLLRYLPKFNFPEIEDMAVDAEGNLYLAGANGYTSKPYHELLVIKLNNNLRPKNRYSHSSSLGKAYSILPDSSNTLLVAGVSVGDYDISTPGEYQAVYADKQDAFLMRIKYLPVPDAGIVSIDQPANGSCGPGMAEAYLRFKNFSPTVPLDSVFIQWQTGKEEPKGFWYRWVEKIKQGDTSKLVYLGKIYVETGKLQIGAWTDMPNGDYDDNTYNDTLRVSYNIYTKPNAGVKVVSKACKLLETTFTSAYETDTSSRYHWDFGDNNKDTGLFATNVFASAGVYNVRLIVVNKHGCSDTAISQVKVSPEVTVNFEHTTACYENSALFENTSMYQQGLISFRWYFGDGLTGTGNNPFHTYKKPGTYLVTLLAWAASGCRDSMTKWIHIHPKTTMDFSSQSDCVLQTTFRDQSTYLSLYERNFTWDFGDGGTSTDSVPVHTYAKPGSYKVRMDITIGNTCKFSYEKMVDIFSSVEASFRTEGGKCESGVQFISTSFIGSGNVSYLWLAGDGATSDSESPYYNYSKPGSYQAALIITTDQGCSDTAWQTIDILSQPVLAYHTRGNCTGDPVNFIDSSYMPGGKIAARVWEFGDGTTSTEASPAHRYADTGTYYTRLYITTDKGCKDFLSGEVKVYRSPEAHFSVQEEACADAYVAIKESSAAHSDSAAAYFWNFGDGTTGTASQPLKKYDAAGTYIITLAVKNSSNCTDTTREVITVKPLPDAGFTYIKKGNRLTFTPADNTAESYHWQFGNGDSSALSAPATRYDSSGKYTVSLKVRNNEGCEAIHTREIAIENIPGWSIFPNPVRRVITIEKTGMQNDPAQAAFFNMLGQQMFTVNDIEKTITIELPDHVRPGLYLLVIYEGDEQKVLKVRVE